MKYWREDKENSCQGDEWYNLLAQHKDDEGENSRVLSVGIRKSGGVDFMECCDDYFSESYTDNQAIEMLQEMIDLIRAHQ